MNKQKFNRELLDKTLIRDGATLDDTKELPNSLNQNSRISFICPCGTPDIKVFRTMVENGGARCKLCTEHERKMKIKTTMLEKPRKFDRALLDETFARDNASHDETKELPTRLNRESHIPFKCACGTPDIKVFRMMVENGGARCKLCTEHERQMKIKTTTLERFGVEYPSQSAEIMERQKATMLKNYGVEHGFQSAEIMGKVKATMLERFGVEYPSQSAEIMERQKATMLKNYGVEHPMQSAEVKDKVKVTCLENHGVEYPMQSAEVREKSKATMLENHGVEYCMQSSELRKKAKATMLERFGVEHGFQSAEIMERKKATMLKKYGVEHAMQCTEIFERAQKNSYKSKDYTTPSGQVWNLRGYEPLVAPKLIDEYGEDDIGHMIQQFPRIWWTDSKGMRHKYYCDFYVKSHKLVVEVKGPYTAVVDAEKIAATREVVNSLGYGYRLIVIDKGNWIRDELSPSILGAEGGESANIRLA